MTWSRTSCNRATIIAARQHGLGWLRASGGTFHEDGHTYTRALVEHGRRAAHALLDATVDCPGDFMADARRRAEQWLDTLPIAGVSELHQYKAQAIYDGREPVMLLMVETDWMDDHIFWHLDPAYPRLGDT